MNGSSSMMDAARCYTSSCLFNHQTNIFGNFFLYISRLKRDYEEVYINENFTGGNEKNSKFFDAISTSINLTFIPLCAIFLID